MLMLTRRIGDALMIGDTIKVAVVEVKGDQVRIGIAAPCDVPVYREEIFRRIQRERSDDHDRIPLP